MWVHVLCCMGVKLSHGISASEKSAAFKAHEECCEFEMPNSGHVQLQKDGGKRALAFSMELAAKELREHHWEYLEGGPYHTGELPLLASLQLDELEALQHVEAQELKAAIAQTAHLQICVEMRALEISIMAAKAAPTPPSLLPHVREARLVAARHETAMSRANAAARDFMVANPAEGSAAMWTQRCLLHALGDESAAAGAAEAGAGASAGAGRSESAAAASETAPRTASRAAAFAVAGRSASAAAATLPESAPRAAPHARAPTPSPDA